MVDEIVRTKGLLIGGKWVAGEREKEWVRPMQRRLRKKGREAGANLALKLREGKIILELLPKTKKGARAGKDRWS